jgi:hypothetical protein
VNNSRGRDLIPVLGPSLTLDVMLTLQLVRLTGFWKALPESFPAAIRVEAEKAGDKAIDIAAGRCSGCGGVRGAITPTHNAVWASIAAIAEVAGEATLETLVAFIAKQRGYRPNPIVVYYKIDDGVNRKFKF